MLLLLSTAIILATSGGVCISLCAFIYWLLYLAGPRLSPFEIEMATYRANLVGMAGALLGGLAAAVMLW